MFTTSDVELLIGRWARVTRNTRGRDYTHLVLVDRAWLTGTTPNSDMKQDGSIGMMLFEPNTPVPFTSFHLPSDGRHEILPGCAPVAITRPWLGSQPQLWTDLRCPSGKACICLTAAR